MPLIDVLLFLLASFVLFLVSLNRVGPPHVQLTKSEDVGGCGAYVDVHLAIDAKGELWLDGESVSAAVLRWRLDELRPRAADTRVLLAIDQRAKFGTSTSWIQELQRRGVKRIAFETRTN